MANSVDSDQLASEEANLSGSTPFVKAGHMWLYCFVYVHLFIHPCFLLQSRVGASLYFLNIISPHLCNSGIIQIHVQ